MSQAGVRIFLDIILYWSIRIRRQIRVNKVLVHEHFNDSVNDIALLRLGKPKTFVIFFITHSQMNGWIYRFLVLPVFPAVVQVLLARKGMSMVRSMTLSSSFDLSFSQAGETLESKRPPRTSCRRL